MEYHRRYLSTTSYHQYIIIHYNNLIYHLYYRLSFNSLLLQGIPTSQILQGVLIFWRSGSFHPVELEQCVIVNFSCVFCCHLHQDNSELNDLLLQRGTSRSFIASLPMEMLTLRCIGVPVQRCRVPWWKPLFYEILVSFSGLISFLTCLTEPLIVAPTVSLSQRTVIV